MMLPMMHYLAGAVLSLLPTSIDCNTDYPVAASLTLNSDGSWSATDGQSGVWQGGGLNSDYEARVTMLTGTLSSGTSGSWLPLSTSRTWSRGGTSSGDFGCSFTLEIRKASDGIVLSTTGVSLTVYGTA
jgi:hypothetical protein